MIQVPFPFTKVMSPKREQSEHMTQVNIPGNSDIFVHCIYLSRRHRGKGDIDSIGTLGMKLNMVSYVIVAYQLNKYPLLKPEIPH